MFRFVLILFLGFPFLSNAVNFQNVMVFDEILNQHSNIRVALPDEELPPQYFYVINNAEVTEPDGFLYRYTLPEHVNGHIAANGVQSVVLFENDVLMYQINCWHGNIQNLGMGRTSFCENGYLYFSTSDNLPLAGKRYHIVLNNLLPMPAPMPMTIHTNCETRDADSIAYGRLNADRMPVFAQLDEHNNFIIDRNNLVPGHYYINFLKDGNLKKTNYLYVFPGIEPLVIQILRDEAGFIDVYLTGNFADKRIVCDSELANEFEMLEGVGQYNHIMVCNFINKFYEDMNLKVITPINENLEQVVEIPFFPNDRFAVREYAREVQEIVQPVLPIVNPIIIAKNYDESDRIEYGRVGSVDNPKVILPNECQEFIADLDRLAPGYYYLNFYQGEDRHKTNFLYVFPGLHPSAIQIHRYFDGNMSYDLTGDFRDKKFSCVSEARAHNDLGRIHQNKLAFDRTNFIDEVLDLKVVVSMPVGENLERIIEIPIFPNEQNAVRDYNREALNIVPVPAPVIHIVEQAPVPVPAPVIHVIEQVLAPEPIIILPVRHGPNLSVMDKASVERIAQELNQDDAGRRWEAAEDIMRKAPACKRNYVELQRIQRTIINERDIVKFNNFNELLAYFDLRGPQYERICEKSLRERPQILDGRIAYPLSHPMGVTDYDYMISVASLLRHCEQRDLLSEDDVGLLKMIFTGYFDDQIGRCSTGLFIRMFLVHMEILKKFYAN